MSGFSFIGGDVADLVLAAEFFSYPFESTGQAAGSSLGAEDSAAGVIGEFIEIFGRCWTRDPNLLLLEFDARERVAEVIVEQVL